MIEEARSYFAEAERWETDRSSSLARTARHAWIVAGIAVATTVLAAVALLMLAPQARRSVRGTGRFLDGGR